MYRVPVAADPLIHPSNEELLIYAVGNPDNELLSRINAHIGDCGKCARAVVEMVREDMRAKREE